MTNAVVYSGAAFITSVKSFIVLGHSRNFFLLLSLLLYLSLSSSHHFLVEKKISCKKIKLFMQIKIKKFQGPGTVFTKPYFFLI
jgi:hypothetical protein